MARKKTEPKPELTAEDLVDEARANWELAVAHLAKVTAEWEAKGEPFTDWNQNGIEYIHPLYKIVRDARLDVANRLKEIPKPSKSPGGRKPVGVPSSISESPASRRRRLRAVEGGST